MSADYIDVVFDGPPSHESGRFVEVEDASGKSIRYGEWVLRPDGFWALRLPRSDIRPSLPKTERLSDYFGEVIDGAKSPPLR